MKSKLHIAIQIVLSAFLFLHTGCPVCFVDHGVSIEVSSRISNLPAKLHIPKVRFIDSVEIVLDSTICGDSVVIWSNHNISEYVGSILTFSITLQDSVGNQCNFELDTIRVEKNMIEYFISIGYSSYPDIHSRTHKYHCIEEITGDKSDTMVTVYYYQCDSFL